MVFLNRLLRKVSGAKREEATGERRKLHNEELYDLNCSPMVIKSRIRWVGHMEHTRKMRGGYGVVVGKTEGQRPPGTLRHRWQNNVQIKMDVRTSTEFIWLQTVTSGRLLCIWQWTFRFCKMRAFLVYLGSYNLHVVSCNSAGLKLFQYSAIRCSHHLHYTTRTHHYSQFTSPLPTSTSFTLNIVTAVYNETLKLTPCMQLNPEHILNSPPFPHTPCDWPVVQRRWWDSAILASQAGMAWAAIHHHTTSPQLSQTTRPNIFSGTPRLNQKAWNNPMRIKCA